MHSIDALFWVQVQADVHATADSATPVKLPAAACDKALAAASQIVSPEMIRPFPKAPPRKNPSTRRRTGKSCVLTVDASAAGNRHIRRIFVRRRKSAEKIRRQPSSAEF